MLSLQEQINAIAEKSRKETLSKSSQLTLGELILKLEPIVKKNKGKKIEDLPDVYFDFCRMFPTTTMSWRGSYKEVCLDFTDGRSENKSPLNIRDFFKLIKNTIGKEFEGYKGGEYVMDKHTPVWIDNYGRSTDTGLVDVLDLDYQVLLITQYTEF